jgi:hypothetical protein
MDQIMRTGAPFEDRDTGSHCAFQIAAAWMTNCLTKHHKCKPASPTYFSLLRQLPTRVIDVGPSDGSQNPRLHEGGSSKALYFTLSYRWNQNIPATFQTVKSNLDEYMVSIRLEILPKTMRDAILITRRFGIRYLWIDALCIIQDSEDDWAREANTMANVYKNSLLTIAVATDTNSEADVCFRPRSRLRVRPLGVNSLWADGSTKYVFADRRITQDGSRPPSALDKRAWVLQEQLLSPRVLTYSNEELYWDCICLNASETFPNGLPGFYDADLKLMDMRLFKEAVLTGSADLIKSQRFYNSWKEIVEEYSSRQMTKETDKLAAILGLAKEAAFGLKDTFLLGLWKGHLHRDLLWWVKDPETASRPATFKAPSWSWASINAPISFELRGRDYDRRVGNCINIILTEVESDQTLPNLTGKLIVRGKLFPLVPEKLEFVLPPGRSPPSWKEDMEGVDPASVKCLIVLATEHYIYGLGLVPLDDIGRNHKRVGIVDWRIDPREFGYDINKLSWNDESEMRTIIIL